VTEPPEFPARVWAEQLAGYRWHKQTIGRSEAETFRLEAEGRPTLFVKTERTAPFAELRQEAHRLHWLVRQGLPCPEVLGTVYAAGRFATLTTALEGRDLATSGLAPDRICAILAEALLRLHALGLDDCPFDHRLNARIDLAQARVEAGVVDEADFDSERLGRTAEDLLAELHATRPVEEDPVVAHGDACLPNFIAKDGRLNGYVDCARLGVADRHQDLALAARSIAFNLGETWVSVFLAAYGAKADPARLAFYRLLDEFF
jgi:aminoglycoside 3'-phosphotransferase-2